MQMALCCNWIKYIEIFYQSSNMVLMVVELNANLQNQMVGNKMAKMFDGPIN